MSAEVKKNTQPIMKGLLTTNETPYKMSLYLPAILQRIYRMDEYVVTVNHDPGQVLEVITNDRRLFKGFKISRTGNGNERELEVNGKKFILTENSLKTKPPVGKRRRPETQMKISWQGNLPSNTQEAEAFLLRNRINAEFKWSWKNIEADIGWKMDRPSFDFSSPWNGTMDFNVSGNGNWGNYNITREITAAVAHKIIHLSVAGDASFTKGFFSKFSPITTDVGVKYLITDRKLEGKFSTVIKGYEYSVAFPNSSSVEPEITWGLRV